MESSEVEEQSGYKALHSIAGQVPPNIALPSPFQSVVQHVYHLLVCENMESSHQQRTEQPEAAVPFSGTSKGTDMMFKQEHEAQYLCFI